MRVTGLRLYPVKSLGGVEVESAVVEPSGIAGDRRWALVDDAGDQVTAREVHQLLRVTAQVVDEDTIRLTDRADGASILVDTPLGLGPVPVGLSRQPFLAPADEDVNRLAQRPGRDAGAAGLAGGPHLAADLRRPRRPARGRHEPRRRRTVLLVSETSMAQLNAWIQAESDAPDVADIDPADISDAAARRWWPLDILRSGRTSSSTATCRSPRRAGQGSGSATSSSGPPRPATGAS